MIALLVHSMRRRAGKTTVALALGRRLRRAGARVGYWSPFATPTDGDRLFAKQVLGLTEDVEALIECGAEPGDEATGLERMRHAAERLAKHTDLLLVEVNDDELPARGLTPALLEEALANLASVKDLGVARYSGDGLADEMRAMGKAWPQGVMLINGVVDVHRWFVRDRVMPVCEAQGVSVVGILPQDAGLAATTVRDLGNALGASVLVSGATGALDRLFESVMFGSMSAEDGRAYLSRKQAKLVISRGDHPDVHLAALGTDMRCLLLAGGYPSYPFVLDKAEELGIPVLSVDADTSATIDRVDGLLSDARCWTEAKLNRFEQLVQDQLGWATLEELAK